MNWCDFFWLPSHNFGSLITISIFHFSFSLFSLSNTPIWKLFQFVKHRYTLMSSSIHSFHGMFKWTNHMDCWINCVVYFSTEFRIEHFQHLVILCIYHSVPRIFVSFFLIMSHCTFKQIHSIYNRCHTNRWHSRDPVKSYWPK